MEELAHRFLVAAHQRRDLGDPFATSAGQHHLAATHLYAIRRAQTGSQGRALLVGERTDKDGRSHTSQDTPFRPTFTEIALGSLRKDRAAMAVAETIPASEIGTASSLDTFLDTLHIDLSNVPPPPARWVRRMEWWDLQDLRKDTRRRLKRSVLQCHLGLMPRRGIEHQEPTRPV